MRQMMMLLAAMLFASCASEENKVTAQTMTQKIFITVDGVTKTATLADNSATQTLVARLQSAPVNVTLNSSGGFEIWGTSSKAYTLQGIIVQAGYKGIVIQNGKKIIR